MLNFSTKSERLKGKAELTRLFTKIGNKNGNKRQCKKGQKEVWIFETGEIKEVMKGGGVAE